MGTQISTLQLHSLSCTSLLATRCYGKSAAKIGTLSALFQPTHNDCPQTVEKKHLVRVHQLCYDYCNPTMFQAKPNNICLPECTKICIHLIDKLLRDKLGTIISPVMTMYLLPRSVYLQQSFNLRTITSLLVTMYLLTKPVYIPQGYTQPKHNYCPCCDKEPDAEISMQAGLQ